MQSIELIIWHYKKLKIDIIDKNMLHSDDLLDVLYVR